MGQVELTEMGCVNKQLHGDMRIDVIAKDKFGNYWIETNYVSTNAPAPETSPFKRMFIRKELMEELCRIHKSSNNTNSSDNYYNVPKE